MFNWLVGKKVKQGTVTGFGDFGLLVKTPQDNVIEVPIFQTGVEFKLHEDRDCIKNLYNMLLSKHQTVDILFYNGHLGKICKVSIGKGYMKNMKFEYYFYDGDEIGETIQLCDYEDSIKNFTEWFQEQYNKLEIFQKTPKTIAIIPSFLKNLENTVLKQSFSGEFYKGQVDESNEFYKKKFFDEEYHSPPLSRSVWMYAKIHKDSGRIYYTGTKKECEEEIDMVENKYMKFVKIHPTDKIIARWVVFQKPADKFDPHSEEYCDDEFSRKEKEICESLSEAKARCAILNYKDSNCFYDVEYVYYLIQNQTD